MKTLKTFLKSNFAKALVVLVALTGLYACYPQDNPFNFVPRPTEDDGSGVDSGVPGGSGGVTGGGSGGGEQGCTVLWQNVEVRFLATDDEDGVIKGADHDYIPIGDIPIKVDGSQLTLNSGNIPDINVVGLSTTADLKVVGGSSTGTGTYDSASGEANIDGLSFKAFAFAAGTTTPIEADTPDGSIPIDGINLITGTVKLDGVSLSIEESGSPLDKETGYFSMVGGIVIDPSLPLLGGQYPNEALTATFRGTISPLFEECVGSGVDPSTVGAGGGSGGGDSFTTGSLDVYVLDGITEPTETDQPVTGPVDLGVTIGMVMPGPEGSEILDCSSSGNRGVRYRTIYATNKSDKPVTVNEMKSFDTDGDSNDENCSGVTEFPTASLESGGGTVCEKMFVAGASWDTFPCVLPPNGEGFIRMGLAYQPFNVSKPVLQDTGALKFTIQEESPPPEGEEGEAEPEAKEFAIPLLGKTEPGYPNALWVMRVVEGEAVQPQMASGGTLKVRVAEGENTGLTDFVISNTSFDQFEVVGPIILEGEEAGVFTLTGPAEDAVIVPAGSTGAGFSIKFTPAEPAGQKELKTAKLIIQLRRAGSEAIIPMEFTVEGTKEVESLLGKDVYLQFWYLAANLSARGENKGDDARLVTDDATFEERASVPLKIKIDNFGNVELVTKELDLTRGTCVGDATKVCRREAPKLFTNSFTFCNDEALDPQFGPDHPCLSTVGDNVDITNPSVQYQDGHRSYFFIDIQKEEGSFGFYDEATGQLVIPDLIFTLYNPYRASITGFDSDQELKIVMRATLSTGIRDTKTMVNPLDPTSEINLDPGSLPNHSLEGIELEPCSMTEGETFFDAIEPPGVSCFTSDDGKYLQGSALTLLPDLAKEQHGFVLTGVSLVEYGPFFVDGSSVHLVLVGVAGTNPDNLRPY